MSVTDAVAVKPVSENEVSIDIDKKLPEEGYELTIGSDGVIMLVDGLRGNTMFSSGRWLGFADGDGLDAVIDLGEPVEISSAGYSRDCGDKGTCARFRAGKDEVCQCQGFV